MKKKWITTVFFILASGLMLSISGTAVAQQEIRHDWVLGGATPGHTTFQVAVAYSKILEKIPGFSAVVENSGGGYDGIDLTMAKDIDGAATGLIGVVAKYNGIGKYKGQQDQNIRVFMPMYTAPVQVIVKENSPIQSIMDLRDKRVGTMPVGAAGHSIIMNVLKAADITEDDFQSFEIEIMEMIDGLKNGNLDAVMINTGVPTSAVMELKATHKIRFIPIEKDLAIKAAGYSPATVPGEMSAGTYADQKEPISTVLTYAVMCTRSDIPEEVIYTAVKAIWTEQESLKSSHASQKAFSKQWFLDVGNAVPLHSGVRKFMDQMGW